MEIMFSFQELKQKADNKFNGFDNSHSNLIFYLSLIFEENIIIEFQYELQSYGNKYTKYLKKETNCEKKLEVQKISNQDNKFIDNKIMSKLIVTYSNSTKLIDISNEDTLDH